MLKYKSTLTLLAIGAFVLTACPKNEDPPADDDVDTTSTTGTDMDTTTETGETGSTTDTTGETGFIISVDIPAENACDPWAQDCPEGEKCAAWAMGDTWDSNKCVPLKGDGVTGDDCVYDGAALGTDDCDVGYMCYYTTDGVGSCIPLCTGSADDPMCPDNFNCSISNDGSLLLCVYNCNPLLQDCVIEGTGCYFDGSLFNCDPDGDIPEGDPCGYINDCSPGLICLDAVDFPDCAGAACCSAYCDLNDPVCSLAGTECVAFWDMGQAPPGQENLGVCVLPG